MFSKHSLENIIPQDASLADTLHRLAEALNHCAHTLRETHDLVAPQLDELEKPDPGLMGLSGSDKPPAPHRDAPRDPGQSLKPGYDQRSLGRPQSRSPA